jgi:hypothetical protein
MVDLASRLTAILKISQSKTNIYVSWRAIVAILSQESAIIYFCFARQWPTFKRLSLPVVRVRETRSR